MRRTVSIFREQWFFLLIVEVALAVVTGLINPQLLRAEQHREHPGAGVGARPRGLRRDTPYDRGKLRHLGGREHRHVRLRDGDHDQGGLRFRARRGRRDARRYIQRLLRRGVLDPVQGAVVHHLPCLHRDLPRHLARLHQGRPATGLRKLRVPRDEEVLQYRPAHVHHQRRGLPHRPLHSEIHKDRPQGLRHREQRAGHLPRGHPDQSEQADLLHHQRAAGRRSRQPCCCRASAQPSPPPEAGSSCKPLAPWSSAARR